MSAQQPPEPPPEGPMPGLPYDVFSDGLVPWETMAWHPRPVHAGREAGEARGQAPAQEAQAAQEGSAAAEMGAEAVRIYALLTIGHGVLWVRSGPYGPAHAPFWICQRSDGRRVLWGRGDAKREEVQGG